MTAVYQDTDGTTDRDRTVRFGLVELDLLATHAGVPMPFPLRVPSFGRIAAEREVLLDTAGQTLAARGLADDDGPTGVAAELVAALRSSRGGVDLVLSGPDGPVGIAAIVYRSWALICAQALGDDPTNTVLVRRVADTALAATLFAMVPARPQATSMPIRLPASLVRKGIQHVDGVDPEQRLRDEMRDLGGDPDLLNQLAGLLPTLTGAGQAGATRRVGTTSVRAGDELSWLDGPRGRVTVRRADDGWVSVNPLRPNTMRSAFDELAMIAGKPE